MSKYNFILHLYVLIHWIFTFIFYFDNQLSKELFEKLHIIYRIFFVMRATRGPFGLALTDTGLFRAGLKSPNFSDSIFKTQTLKLTRFDSSSRPSFDSKTP